MKFIYHFWNKDKVKKITDFQVSPLVYSIASLRHHCTDISIKVLVPESSRIEWEDYPEILNFDVVVVPAIKKSNYIFNHYLNQKIQDLLNEVLNSNVEELVAYCDADIIWIKNPLPLFEYNNFLNISFKNSGFYYFNNKEINAISFLNRWKDLLEQASVDLESNISLIKEIKACSNNYNVVTDESVLHLLVKTHSHLIQEQNIVDHNLNLSECKNCGIHIMSWFTKDKMRFCEDMIEINQILSDFFSLKPPIMSIKNYKKWLEINPNHGGNPLRLDDCIKLI